MLMACFTVLFVILTIIEVTSLHCSDQQLPASGDDDQQVAIVLQYCLVDNCTIMMIDTGEELDIAYATDSLIVTTSTDGHTESVVIAKLENELLCFTPSSYSSDDQAINGQFVGPLVVAVLIGLTSGCNAVVHLVFKELRNTFGKLVIFYSLSVVLHCAVVIMKLILHHVVAANSRVTCQIITTAYMMTVISIEGFSTCILSHLAYVLYCSHNRASLKSTRHSNHLLRRYVVYAVGQLMLFLTIIVTFDVLSGTGKYTLQLDGHCIFFSESSYTTMYISDVNTIINKCVQITMFAVYLFYFYKINKNISRQHSHKLSIVAITMGATIGLSQFIWMANTVSGNQYSAITGITGALFLFLQQCVITINFMCTNKMSHLCKERFQKNRVTPNAD